MIEPVPEITEQLTSGIVHVQGAANIGNIDQQGTSIHSVNAEANGAGDGEVLYAHAAMHGGTQ